MKTIINYPGSKWRIAKWIISFFPEHHSYLEPFSGSLAVLMNKPRSNIETVNDLDGNVVNFFQWVKKDPEKLAYEIYFTPYSRLIYDDAFQEIPEDSFQKAVNFCIRLNMGYGIRINGEKSGWKNDIQGRERAYAANDWATLPDRIIKAAERLRGIQIENRSAIEVIKRFNFSNVLIYADPPYLMSTRHGKQYRHEMNDTEHMQLLKVLLKHKGPVLLSGYNSDLYNDILNDWHREEITARTQSGSKRQEILWMNFKPAKEEQLSLF